MGYKKLSNEQEKQLVQEYLNGETTQVLMQNIALKHTNQFLTRLRNSIQTIMHKKLKK